MSGAYGLAGPVGFIFLISGFAVLLGVRRMRVAPIESLDVRDETEHARAAHAALKTPEARQIERPAPTPVALGLEELLPPEHHCQHCRDAEGDGERDGVAIRPLP